MARPTVQIPTITKGTRLTDYAGFDLTVEGLAAGGMGLVVWGKNAAKGHQMEAMKLLRPDRLAAAAARSPEQRRAIERQFEDEALVWCHLWYHDCVITTTGLTRLSALGDLPGLILAYAPNGSLRDYLRGSRDQHTYPPLRAALAWAIHIASALAHIHQPDPDHDRPAPLVHCDLKPENVLLNEQGWAQLTDLGLTRAYAALAVESAAALPQDDGPAAPTLTSHQAEVARLRAILQAAGALPAEHQHAAAAGTLFATRTLRIPAVAPARGPATDGGTTSAVPAITSAAIGSRGPVAGSPPYMAPEQWLGLDAAVPATDLYAFGVLLYELFAGTETPHPFPFDPTPYLTPQLYAHALATGYDPALLAWHAAHTAPSGPAHRLGDPEVAAEALRSGPLAELANRGDAAGRDAAEVAVRRLDALIRVCLAPDSGARPLAADVRQQLIALITDPCGLEHIQLPAPRPASSRNEGAFWGNLGMTYSRLGRHEEAITVKRRAVQHDPTNVNNWLNLGASLDDLGQQERRQAGEAGAGGHRYEEAAALRAAARQHFEEALAAYQQAESHLTADALVASPTLPAALANNQGNTLANLERYAEAAAVCQRALTLRTDALDTRFNLAMIYANWSQVHDASRADCLGRLQAAQAEIEIVLGAAPNDTGARALASAIARALADPAHRF